jgi:hypothetical protein
VPIYSEADEDVVDESSYDCNGNIECHLGDELNSTQSDLASMSAKSFYDGKLLKFTRYAGKVDSTIPDNSEKDFFLQYTGEVGQNSTIQLTLVVGED